MTLEEALKLPAGIPLNVMIDTHVIGEYTGHDWGSDWFRVLEMLQRLRYSYWITVVFPIPGCDGQFTVSLSVVTEKRLDGTVDIVRKSLASETSLPLAACRAALAACWKDDELRPVAVDVPGK